MKKKLFLLMALLCCFVLAVGILAACNGNESEQPDVIDPNATYYTVTFDLNGGDGSIAPRDYAAGYKMELPTPTRDGYRFVGWQDAFGEKFDNSSLMPDNDLILYAQWEPVVTSYEDEFVYFKPATEGVKDPETKSEYPRLTGYVYVELTSDMLGGRHKVGEENNFDLASGVEMEYSVKSGYTLQWWRDYEFSVANGAQRFTLNYGSNFQFLTVSSNQQTQATYLIDFYVLHDYQVKLHTNIYDENPYETVWVIENRTFASDTEAYQMKDFEFDKRVYWDEDAGWGEWKAFDYSTPITQDWDLYQTYKPYTVEAELDGGTLDGELSIIPYTEYQQLPVPEKEGYDFIGWQLPDAENDKEDYFADITGFNSTLLLGGGRSTRTNVYFDTLTAVWLPKHYHKVTDGDEVSFEETVPVVTYTDRSMNEINEVIYVVKGTPYVLPEKVVYEGSLEFCGWKVWTQDNGGDYYGETFDFDAEVTEPAAMWQDMEVIGGSSSVKGLYLNDSRTFSSLGTGQRIKANLPAQGDYTFTVTTTGTVSFDCNNYGYYATSSKPVTFTVTNEMPYDGLQVFLDVASYTGSFTIKFEGPTGTAEAPSESIADAVYAVGDAVTAPQKSGYTFVGWYDADGTKLSEEGSFDFAMPAFDPDAVYTAKWIKVTITSENTAKGTVSKLTGTYVAGEKVSVTATTKSGYTFIGWYKGDEKVADTLTYEFEMPAENVTYTAKWIKVTITSESTDKGTVSSLTGKYLPGDEVSVTATTKSGYTFIGWYNGDEKVADTLTYEFTMPAENVTYTAKWIKVTITSESTDKGTVSKLMDTYLPGDKVSVTATTKSGYTFIGWYDGDEKVADGLTYEFTMPAEDVTYTAKWIKVTITSESTDKGTVSSLTGKFLPGDKVSVTATTKSGYTFIGWYKGDEKVADGLTYEFTMPAENVTYTAKWIKVTVMSEDTAKGTVSKLMDTYLPGDKVSVTATTKSGYTFIGWYKGDEKVVDTLTYEFTMPAEDVTYTAKWISCPVNLEVSSAAAGSVDMPTTTVAGESVTITATTNAGYTFIGWYKGDEKVADTLTYEFTMPAEDVTYTAKWISCPVNLEVSSAAAGSVDMPATTVAGESVTITATTKAGYTFIGWYKGDEKVADTLTYEFEMPAENVTYTAKWIKVTITSESTDKGTVSSLTGKYLPGDEVSVTATTEPGYTFIGWYKGEEKVADGLTYEFTMPAENVTYTAKWIKVTITSESTDKGTVSSLTGKYLPGDEVSVTATTNLGYTFIGWYKGDEKVVDTLTYEFTMPAENVTYTAKWSVSAEMEPFIFTSTPTSLTITGVTEKGVTSLAVPSYVTAISKGAFSGCSSLESITIPFVGAEAGKTSSDTYQYPFGYIFGTSSYEGGTAVEQRYYGSSTSSTTSTRYYIPASLRSVTVTGGNILHGAFYGCSSLTSITIPDSVTSIGSYAFNDCDNLTSITIPDGVTSIGYGAFFGCGSLTSIYYTGDVAGWCGITGLGNIMSSKRELYMDGNKVGGEIIIPDGVTSIPSYAFAYQTGITSVTIPDSVTSIGERAFYNCSGLTSVTIPAGVTSIGNSAFSYCSSLASIEVDVNNATYASVDGIMYNKAKTEFVLIPDALAGDVTIPAGVTSIDDYAFSGCSSLTSVTIPDTVTSIGQYAFSGCTAEIIWGDDPEITEIGERAFSGYQGTRITISDSVKSIGASAFEDCSGLTSVTIPDSVTSIGESAFYRCSSLTSITIPDGVTSIGNSAFSFCSSLISVTIPDGVTSIGSSAFYYCSNLTSITIPDSVTSIGASAFYGCSGLTSITIPNSVTSIGDSAFHSCRNLTSITIPDGVTSIGDYAFSGCRGLTSVTIGNGVTSIGWGAFSGCSSLISVKFEGTKAKWNAVEKGAEWNYNSPFTKVVCSNGTVSV